MTRFAEVPSRTDSRLRVRTWAAPCFVPDLHNETTLSILRQHYPNYYT